MEYTYRLLTSENLADLNELFKAAFKNEPGVNLMKWKYFDNPAGDAILVGAFDGKTLVASGAMVPEKMIVCNREELIFKCADLMTHPDYQRKGISKKINELLSKKTQGNFTPFSYTLCSKVSTKSFVRNDWTFIEKVVNFFKPYILIKAGAIFKKNDFKSFGFYNNVEKHLDSYKFKNDPASIVLKKDPAYIKWRTSHPNFVYKIICSYDDCKNVNGYLIYSISSNNLLNVLDVESSSDNIKILDQLLDCAEYITMKEKYRGIVILTIKNSPFFKRIKKKNYLVNPFKKGPLHTILDFNIIQYKVNTESISDPGIWDINGLSYDDI